MANPASSAIDIESLRKKHYPSYVHDYKERDAILYALGLGFNVSEGLKYIYERHAQFSTLPTYAIIAAHPALGNVPLEQAIPGFKRAKALHGEQYLRLHAQLPTHGQLITKPQLVDIQDKGAGKGVVAIVRTETRDAQLGHVLAENEFVAYGLGAGGFGSLWAPASRPPAATASNTPPNREPDIQVDIATDATQAALYRLSGDYNPLHIDPVVAKQVGFQVPILHGLCTLGVSVKAVVENLLGGDFSKLRSVKVRFAKHVLPGEKLVVRMWRIDPDAAGNKYSEIQGNIQVPEVLHKVVFETRVPGRNNALAISNAAIEYADTPLPATPLAKAVSKL